ncbi:hypothetical protein [Novosphingobium mathurense]|uniref:Uncharacterized protein n=1 Tax=Novosphingobium mathurense TaxID=428990 RepID=A0A1U6IF63_9SPHN|nr:hypothetical protein [Novosphingobium mathurense]SLK06649.1 hypothetical protein SAMN06295987_10632 [Novosphingobium mathurense]
MTQALTRSPRALTAIAAVLAIGSTPVLAQDSGASAPALTLPQDVNSGSPVEASRSAAPVTNSAEQSTAVQPSIVPPQAQPTQDATVSQPVVMSVAPVVQSETSAATSSSASPSASNPTGSAPADRSRSERSPARAKPAREAPTPGATSRRAAEPVVVPNESGAGTAADGALAQGDVADPVPASPLSTVPPADAGADVAADAPPADDGSDLPIEGILGLLAAAGIAGAGIMAMRSRRKRVRQPRSRQPLPGTYKPAATYSPVRASADASASRAPAAAPMPAGGSAAMASTAAQTPARRAPERKVRAPVTDSGPVPTGEERHALLERMVAAPPDPGNPFTSRKARMRRARIQLQHREHLQKQGMAQSFDWRSYRPATKPSTPTPPLVEA